MGSNPGAPEEKLSIQYNRGWYGQTFGLYGYNNVRSAQWLYIDRLLGNRPEETDLYWFLINPGQFFAFSLRSESGTTISERCPSQVEICNTHGAKAELRIENYTLEGSTVSIVAPEGVTLIENEVWYEGWRAKICDGNNRCIQIESTPSNQCLRSWDIPVGTWTMKTYFRVPYLRLAYALAAVGLIGSFLLALRPGIVS